MREAEQQVKREINKMRREAGYSQAIPADIWDTAGVKQILQSATTHVEENGADFEDDYPLSSKINRLNKALNAEYERRVLERSSAPTSSSPRRSLRSKSIKGAGLKKMSQGTALEWQCGQAVGDYLAREMEKDDKVYWFRQHFSGGELLTLHEAWDMLTNPLFQMLTLHDFHSLGLPYAYLPGSVTLRPKDDDEFLLPLYEWDTEVLRELRHLRNDNMYNEAVVQVEAPDGTIFRRRFSVKGQTPFNHTYPLLTKAEFYGKTDPLVDPVLVEHENHWGPAGQEEIEEWFERAGASVVMEATSVADDLIQNQWPISSADALRFLLTGLPPRIAPISVNYVSSSPDLRLYTGEENGEDVVEGWRYKETGEAFTRAVLFVQSWVQPEAVAAFWRVGRMGSNRTLPRAENIAIFQFVINKTAPCERFQWQSLADQWNKETGQNLSRATIKIIYSRTRAALFPNVS